MNPLAILKERFALKCIICKQKDNGACIQCSYQRCCESYHVSCGYKENLTFDVLEGDSDVEPLITVSSKYDCALT